MINRLVFENLKHRWVRTALSIAAIAIQVTMVLTLVGLTRGLLQDQAKRSTSIGADLLVRPPESSALSFSIAMSEKYLNLVEQQPHVDAVTGVLIQGTGLLTSVTGIDLASFDRMSGGFKFLRGGPFQHDDDVIIDDFYAEQHKHKVGDRIAMLNKQWRVCGIVEPGMLARVFVQLKVLQGLASSPGKITVIYAKLDQPSLVNSVVEQLRVRLRNDQVFSMEEYTSLFKASSVPMLQGFIYVVIGVGVVVGFLVVFLSMYTAVLERTREIGILKALGATPAYVLRILLSETAVLAVAGSVAGILLSYGTQWLIRATAPGSLVQAIVPDWWPIASAIALAGAMLGAAYPGLKAARQDVIEALSYE